MKGLDPFVKFLNVSLPLATMYAFAAQALHCTVKYVKIGAGLFSPLKYTGVYDEFMVSILKPTGQIIFIPFRREIPTDDRNTALLMGLTWFVSWWRKSLTSNDLILIVLMKEYIW